MSATKLLTELLISKSDASGKVMLTDEFQVEAVNLLGGLDQLTAAITQLKAKGFYTLGDGCLILSQKPVGRKNKQGRSIPTPKVPYRELSHADHALHLNWILSSQALRDYAPAQHVAFALSRDMWADLNGRNRRAPNRREWSDPYPAPLDHIRYLTGLGESAASKAIKHVVESGFFIRRDSGSGGKGKGSGAVYVPTLPDFR